MWFFMFVMSVAINCSFTIYFACYCIAIEGFEMLYLLGLIEALVFCGLGWILTCTSVSHLFYLKIDYTIYFNYNSRNFLECYS